MLSAGFPASQCPNHHFKLLLEQRNVSTCCPPSAGTAVVLALSLREEHVPWSRCPGKLSPFSSHHCCLLAACSCVHTPRRKHLPVGMCIHNSFPPPAEKLHYSKAGIETTISSLELFLSPKSGNDLLGKSQSKPINPVIFSGSKIHIRNVLFTAGKFWVCTVPEGFAKLYGKDCNRKNGKKKQMPWTSFYPGEFYYAYYGKRQKINFTIILAEPDTQM